MSEPGPVTLENGELWTCDLTLKQVCRTLDRFESVSSREVKAGAMKRYRLDTAGRREDDNALVFKKDEELKEAGDQSPNKRRKTRTRYRFSKGLAMEAATAAALTTLDRPEQVRGYWSAKNGHPNYFAEHHHPDILVRWDDAPPSFQVVCEVSSGRTMARYLRGQLASALNHCWALHEGANVETTYGLLVNPARIGTDKDLQKTYRDFLAENSERTAPDGPVRLVALRTGDFGSILRQLAARDDLQFPKAVFAGALDKLHMLLRQEEVPKGAAWMVETFVATVTADADLFDPDGGTQP